MFPRFVSFVGTALAFGCLSCLGITAIPFTLPVFNVFWEVNDALLKCIEHEEFCQLIEERGGKLQEEIDTFFDLAQQVAPHLAGEIQHFAQKADKLLSKELQNLSESEKWDFVSNCVSLGLQIRQECQDNPYGGELYNELFAIGQEFCHVVQQAENYASPSLGSLILNLGKALVGCFDELGITSIFGQLPLEWSHLPAESVYSITELPYVENKFVDPLPMGVQEPDEIGRQPHKLNLQPQQPFQLNPRPNNLSQGYGA